MSSQTILNCLSIEPSELAGKHVHITENHGSESSWILSCVVADRLQRGDNICLIIMHHTFGHFHNCCYRLGINLKFLQKEKRLVVIEGQKLLLTMKNIDNLKFLNTIARNISEGLESLAPTQEDQTTFIAVDDLSAFCDLGCSISNILKFVSILRTHVFLTNYALMTNVHVSDETTKLLSNSLIYQSDAAASIHALKTGPSREVHGRIEVEKIGSNEPFRIIQNLKMYHFHIKDQGANIFAPGTILIK